MLLLVPIALLPATGSGQSITVSYEQTLRIEVPGATAAYSLDPLYAEASVDGNTVVVFGRNAGDATIVAVTKEGARTFHVHIPQPPPSRALASARRLAGLTDEGGSYESRYTSDIGRWENVFDFTRHQGDRTIRFHLNNADVLDTSSHESHVGFPVAFYQISAPQREITLLDQMVTNSPLTLDEGIVVRGFHLREDSWIFHVGYSSLATFQNLFLPAEREGIVGLGYRYRLNAHSTLTPNLYYFGGRRDSSDGAQRGSVASLLYDYQRGQNLDFQAEAGFSGGLGQAARFNYVGERDQVRGNVRYEPRHFASSGLSNLHGLTSNLGWARLISERLSLDLNYTGNRYMLPRFNQTNLVWNAELTYRLARHWSAMGGGAYAIFKSRSPLPSTVNSLALPWSLAFDSKHFGETFQYQYARNGGQSSGGNQLRETVHLGWSHWHVMAFVDRQSQAPTLGFIYQNVPGLQQALEELGLSATTPQQIADLLRDNTSLIALGYINQVTVNLSPLRLQGGGSFSWSRRDYHRQQFYYNFLYNSNELVRGGAQTAIHTANYSRRLTESTDLFSSFSIYRTKNQGHPSDYRPMCEVGVRRSFTTVPSLLIPGRHGTISGVIFLDPLGQGAFTSGMRTLTGVEIVLDGVRRAHSDRNGLYAFSQVPYGQHVVEAIFKSQKPYFFTTASRAEVETNGVVNFGITFSISHVFGIVQNDAGIGVPAVGISFANGTHLYGATTDMGGRFSLAGLPAGTYEARLRPESLPEGYSLEDLQSKHLSLDPSAPSQITFTVKAFRNIAGRVSVYQAASGRQVPLAGATVKLRELSRECHTDESGAYLFRDLPAGTFSVVVVSGKHQVVHQLSLPATPVFLKDIDFKLALELTK
jgi:hypothetical protein